MGTPSLRNSFSHMTSDIFSALAGLLVKAGVALLAANEIRGLILTAPVFYEMYKAGGTPAAIWLGVCALAGIALSVAVPLLIAKKFKLI